MREAGTRFGISGGGLPYQRDRHHFEQVVMNLAVNARDAMNRGGRLTIAYGYAARLRLTKRCAAIRPRRRTSNSRDRHRAGIDEEIKHRVFEPFFTTKPPGKGTGWDWPWSTASCAKAAVMWRSTAASGSKLRFLCGYPAPPSRGSRPRRGAARRRRRRDSARRRRSHGADGRQEHPAGGGLPRAAAEHGARAIEFLKAGAEVRLQLTDLIMPQVDGRESRRAGPTVAAGAAVVLMSAGMTNLNASARPTAYRSSRSRSRRRPRRDGPPCARIGLRRPTGAPPARRRPVSETGSQSRGVRSTQIRVKPPRRGMGRRGHPGVARASRFRESREAPRSDRQRGRGINQGHTMRPS